MSRVDDYDGEGPYITAEMWQHNVQLALKGRKGQKALRELRDALLALPEKRLIARALCTAGKTRPEGLDDSWRVRDFDEIIDSQGGAGVCAVGAYAWHKKVKAGMEPTAAFESLPMLADTDSGIYDTKMVGVEAGLTRTLAYEFAYLNDETYESLSPEERWIAFMVWIEKQLITEPVTT